MPALLALLLLPLAIAGPAFPEDLTGRVLDEAGAALADARVWVVSYARSEPEPTVFGPAHTDPAGVFQFSEVSLPAPGARSLGATVIAHCTGHALGFGSAFASAIGTASVEVTCPASAPVSGRVVDEEGRGVAACLLPRSLWLPDPLHPVLGYRVVPTAVAEALGVQTDAEGGFYLDLCSAGQAVAVDVHAGDLSALGVHLDAGETGLPVVVRPPASLQVRLVCPQSPAAAAGIPIDVSAERHGGTIPWTATVATDEAGLAHFPAVKPGNVTASPVFAHDALWRSTGRHVRMKPGQQAELEIELGPTYPVTGRVVDGKTKQPVPGVVIHGAGLPAPPTDAEGRYALRALPGHLTLIVHGRSPEDALAVHPQVASVEVTADGAEAPDIELPPIVRLRGVVVDGGGRPVPDAEVYPYPTRLGPAYLTDPKGRFEIAVAQDVGPLLLRARRKEAMTTQPVTARPGATDAVRLVLVDRAGCRLRVQAVSPAGHPFPGTHVTIRHGDADGAIPVDWGITDAAGRYDSPPLWPDGSYQALVSKTTFADAQTGRWQAKAAGRHDFGAVNLVPTIGVVAGRVVDAAGRPVAEANVAAVAEGPPDTGSSAFQPPPRTDARGRFRLEGLYPGSAFVTAQTDEAIGGAKLQVDGEEGTIVLTPLPHGHKLSAVAGIGSLTGYETDLKVARELFDETAGEHPLWLIRSWALLAPDEALQTALKAGGDVSGNVVRGLIDKLAATDPEGVLQSIALLPGGGQRSEALAAFSQRIGVAAERLPADEAAELLQLARTAADGAVSEARTIDKPRGRAEHLARAAEALHSLDTGAAEPVLREVGRLAGTLRQDYPEARTRLAAARALALIDLPGALKLLEGITDMGDPAQLRAELALSIAASHPAEATELVLACGVPGRDRLVPRVVYAMAPVDLQQALDLVARLEDPFGRARPLGAIALAIAPIDADRAAAILEQAVEAASDLSEHHRGHGNRGEVAAELAAIARRIGYPQVEPIAWLALACRQPLPVESFDDRPSCAYLCGLALACPELAAEVLRDMASQPEPKKGPMPDDWVRCRAIAAAACDANEAARYLRSLEAEDDDTRAEHGTAWVQAIEVLATPAEDRFYLVLRAGSGWAPGADD